MSEIFTQFRLVITNSPSRCQQVNVKLKLTETVIADNDYADDDIDVVKITRDDDAPVDFEVILCCFSKVLILYHCGDIYIHLKHDKSMYNEVISNAYTDTVSLKVLFETASHCDTFVIVGLGRDKVLVLPLNLYTHYLFDKLGIEEKIKSKFSVAFKDLIPSYYRQKFHNNKIISMRRNRKNTYSTYRSRQGVLCPRLNRFRDSRMRISRHYPVKYVPFISRTPVESDNLENEQEELVPSTVTPSLHFSENLSLVTSAVSFPNNALLSTQQTYPSRYREYANYQERLASFERWPHQRPTSTQLSEAGFFLTNDGDLVRCFMCGIGLKDFSQDDEPVLEHVRHSLKCPFLPILLGEDRLASIKIHLRQTDPEFNRRMQLNGDVLYDELSYLQPEYRTMENRLRTFTNWPRHMIQTPQRLAEAGMYYVGVDDYVRCFACDGGFRDWVFEDDPWTRHCRWFPACPFALEQMGQNFVDRIQASVENERFEASGGVGENDALVGAMESLGIRESESEYVKKMHELICRDMGFEEMDLKEAERELYERGNKTPSIENIVDAIEAIINRKHASTDIVPNVEESPLEENKRLKNQVFCMECRENDINALFLPCTHHKLCMSCAESLQTCPVCRRHIKEKIRTYML